MSRDRDRALGLRRFLPDAPAGAWSVSGFTVLWIAGILVPLFGMVLFSFLQTRGLNVRWDITLRAYEKLFFQAGGPVVGRTVRIATTITLIELLLAFPFALWLAKGAKNYYVKLATFTLLTVPFFLSPAARTVVWRTILGREGVVNTVLINANIIDSPIEGLLYSEFAIHLGFIGPYFPTMAWPLFLSMALIDDEYLEASRDLGASNFYTLALVIVPLSLPGVVAGFVFTFIPLLGDNVIPQLLGGNNVLMLSHSVYATISALNYSVAAAMATFVLLAMFALQGILWFALRPLGGLNEVFAGLRR